MPWIEIGSVSDIPRRGARVVKAPGGDIAVFRTGNDEVYALRDRCPHKGGPLSVGIVHDRRVTCPLHGLQVDLRTGQAIAPDEGCARTIPVEVVNGVLRLSVAGGDE
ncbi:MAG: nitrite reductase small subunit NirD [Rhodospirillaceae bacterium]